MKLPYFEVAAFTARPFAGNPAGVCVLEEWLPDPLLQSIATENNLAETAFIVARDGFHEIRWFTPTVEMDLCGHATIGSAHVLFRHLGARGASLVFHSPQAGKLGVARDGERLVLDFPSRPVVSCETRPEIVNALGRSPTALYLARDYFAVFEREADIVALRPNFALLATLPNQGVVVTAPGDDCDFVSRFFAPALGVEEDPATGSTHCNLIPFWAERLGKQTLFARQLSQARGRIILRAARRPCAYWRPRRHLPDG